MKQVNVNEFLKTASYKKNIGDFCFCYYEWYIENQSDELALENFVKLLEWKKDSDETLEIEEKLPNEIYRETVNNLIPFVQKTIDTLISKNLEEKVFYDLLYKKIMDDIWFSKKEEKICALIILMLEGRIPYFCLDKATQMDNEVYRSISDSIYKQISKAYFILEYGYDQRTEVASQLYKLVKGQKDENERIVLIANILGYFGTRLKILHDKLEQDGE